MGLEETLPLGVPLSLTTPSLPAGLSGSTGTWPTACLSCPSQSGVSERCSTISTALATSFSAFLSIVGKLRRGAKPEGKVRRACSFQAAAPTGVLRLQVSDLVPS